MNFWALGGLINGITSTLLGIFVYLKNRKNPLNITYALFCASISFWGYPYFFWQISQDKIAALFWCRALMAGAIFIPIFYFHHLLYLLKLYPQKRKILVFGYLFAFASLSFDFTPLFIKSVGPKAWFSYWPDPGITYYPFLIIWCWFVLYGVYLIICGLRTSTGIVRNQLMYVLLASCIGWGGGATNYPLWFNINFPPIGNIFVSFYILLAAYAIVRYRLMDIKIFYRNAVFTIIYTPILAFPFVIGFIFRDFLLKLVGPSWWITPAILEVILAPSLLYIYLNIKKRDERKSQQAVSEICEDLRYIKTIDELSTTVATRTYTTIGVNYSAIYLLENDHYVLKANKKGKIKDEIQIVEVVNKDSALIKHFFENGEPIVLEELRAKLQDVNSQSLTSTENQICLINASIVTPVFYKNELLGLIAFGDKRSKDPYTDRDIKSYKNLAIYVAFAIKNAQFIEDLNAAHAELLQASTMRRLGDMADGMSHQFHNRFQAISFPLGLVKDMLSRIKTDKLLPEDQDKIKNMTNFISEAEANAVRGGDIARGLLKFARANKADYEMLNVSKALELALDMVEYKHPDFVNVKVTQKIEPSLPLTWANLGYLQDIYFIIIDNAYDAIKRKIEDKPSHKGEVSISIYSENKKTIHIIIKDNGIGMKKEILEKVRAAVPYITTKASSATSGYGAGIHVLRRLVEFHSGKITYDSIYGEGVTVTVDIPVTEKSTKDTKA